MQNPRVKELIDEIHAFQQSTFGAHQGKSEGRPSLNYELKTETEKLIFNSGIHEINEGGKCDSFFLQFLCLCLYYTTSAFTVIK